MRNFSILKWVRNISIAKKLYFVLWIMAFLIAVELVALVFTMNTLSSTRSLVGAEGLWSKSQKNATYYLQKYGMSKNEDDYSAFQYYLTVPFGDTKARKELLKPTPDINVIRAGFVQGRVHPDDIDAVVKLLRRFSRISYLHNAIAYWTEGDSLMTVLVNLGVELHAQVNNPLESKQSIATTLYKVDLLNELLTVLEDKFSFTLGEGSRWLERFILKILFFIALTVELTGLFLTVSVNIGISKGIREIVRVSTKVAKADFTDRAIKYSEDEIGTLADSFNNMTISLEKKVRQQLETERSLRMQKDLYETLLDAISKMGEGVSLSIGEKTVYVNQAFCEMLGYSFNEFVYLPSLFDIVFEDERPRLREKMKSRITGDNSPNNKGETILIRKDNRLINVEYSFNSVTINDHTHSISIIRDITDRKKAEGLLQSAKDAYEKQATELARSNSDLEHFAYISSHDLQEPLRTIVSYLQLLERRFKHKLNSEAEEYINFSIDGAKRMHMLINDLLSYSRIGTNSKIFEKVDCRKAINVVLINLDKTIQDCNAKVILETPMPVVTGDQSQITQLFQNLIENAIKYRQENVTPIIRLASVKENGKWKISVIDNGIGIAKEYSDLIFVIFQRLHSREKYSGSGIGLALCKKIVERHGGTIWVEPNESGGSKFYFTIPDRLS